MSDLLQKHRAHVDDDALAFGQHDAARGLRAQERRGQVEVEHGAPVREAEVLGRRDAGHPGVVDQHVDGTIGAGLSPAGDGSPSMVAHPSTGLTRT
jgi:hypothetical protein